MRKCDLTSGQQLRGDENMNEENQNIEYEAADQQSQKDEIIEKNDKSSTYTKEVSRESTRNKVINWFKRFGYAINNILDMPPHHVTHWSEKTFKKVGELFGLDVVKVCYEPIARYHQSAARTIIWENRLRSLIGIRHRLLDTRLSSRGIHKLSSVLGRIIKPNLTDQLGHTVVVIFRKMND